MVQAMAWCQTGVKSLPEPIMVQFVNEIMPGQASASWSSIEIEAPVLARPIMVQFVNEIMPGQASTRWSSIEIEAPVLATPYMFRTPS